MTKHNDAPQTIDEVVEKCETISKLFEYAYLNRLGLVAHPMHTGEEGFAIVKTQKDYALIHIPQDYFDESVHSGRFAHAYGSSVMYGVAQEPVSSEVDDEML